MLSVLRDNVGGWVAKIFIGLLALSFAVWGIADIFTGYQRDALAVVGDHEISQVEYEFAFQRRVRALSQQFGQNLTIEQARDIGIHRVVLGELIRDAALDNEIDDLNLAVSDDTIAQTIATAPMFQNSQGQFDRGAFNQMLAANGLNEQMFVVLQRENVLRSELAGLVDGGLYVPRTLLEAMARQSTETRVVQHFTVPASAVGDVTDPTPEEQQTYYDENKRSFTAPEFRTLIVLRLEPQDIAETIAVSEEEVQQAYDQRIADFTTPETRDIQQISFDSVEDARAARERISAGEEFQVIAEERGLKPIDYNLGQLRIGELPDEIIAEAVFALAEGVVSEPVEGKLSVVLLRAVSITPETRLSFEDVREDLETRLGLERAQEEILNLHDAIEDARAEGAMLQEIGEKFDLPVISVDATDRSGKDPRGEQITTIPAANAVLRVAFESDIGIENDPIDTQVEGFAWVDVIEIAPPAIRQFEDVREEIVDLWKQRNSRAILLDRAKQIVDELRGGKPFASAATELGQTVKTTDALSRRDTPEGLSASAVSNLFRAPLNGYALAPSPDGESFTIMQVTQVDAPSFDPSSAETANLRNELRNGLSDDLFQQYITGLQSEVGVDINDQLWRLLHGDAS